MAKVVLGVTIHRTRRDRLRKYVKNLERNLVFFNLESIGMILLQNNKIHILNLTIIMHCFQIFIYSLLLLSRENLVLAQFTIFKHLLLVQRYSSF